MTSTPALTALRIVWGSLLAAIGCYVFVLASGVVHTPGAPQGPGLVLPLATAAVTCAAMSVFLPRILHQRAVLHSQIEIVAEPAPEAFSTQYRHAAPTRKVFADPSAAWKAALRCFQQPFILSVALSESVALYGFVLGLMGYGMTTVAPFFTAGFLLVAARFPTEQRVIAPFERWLGATIAKNPQ